MDKTTWNSTELEKWLAEVNHNSSSSSPPPYDFLDLMGLSSLDPSDPSSSQTHIVTAMDLSETSLSITPQPLMGSTQSPPTSSSNPPKQSLLEIPTIPETRPIKRKLPKESPPSRRRRPVRASRVDKLAVKPMSTEPVKQTKPSKLSIQPKAVEPVPVNQPKTEAPSTTGQFYYIPSQTDKSLLHVMTQYNFSIEQLVDYWLKQSGGQISKIDRQNLIREWDARITLFKQHFPGEAKSLMFYARGASLCGIDISAQQLFPEAVAALMKLGHQFIEQPHAYYPSSMDRTLVIFTKIYPDLKFSQLVKALLSEADKPSEPFEFYSLTRLWQNRINLYKERFPESYQNDLVVGMHTKAAGAPPESALNALFSNSVILYSKHSLSKSSLATSVCYNPSQVERGLVYLRALLSEAPMEKILLAILEDSKRFIEPTALNCLALHYQARLDLFEILYPDQYQEVVLSVLDIQAIGGQALPFFRTFFPDAVQELSGWGAPITPKTSEAAVKACDVIQQPSSEEVVMTVTEAPSSEEDLEMAWSNVLQFIELQ